MLSRASIAAQRWAATSSPSTITPHLRNFYASSSQYRKTLFSPPLPTFDPTSDSPPKKAKKPKPHRTPAAIAHNSKNKKFISDTPERRQPYGERKDFVHRRDEPFKKPFFKEREPFVFQGFSQPYRPNIKEMADNLIAQIKAIKERTDIAPRIVAYGLKGSAVLDLLRYHDALTGSERLLDSKEAKTATAHELAKALLHAWSHRATGLIRHLAFADSRATPDSEYVQVLANPKGAFTTSLNEAIQAYTIEGEACLARICISSFLDWVDSGLSVLTNNETDDINQVTSTLTHLRMLRTSTDLRLPTYNYPFARTLTRQLHLHIGPTNSGKTHGALVALSKARSGVFAGPLRLLAHEVWERFNQGTISPGVAPRACNLITGEEKKTVDDNAGLYSCTVEMLNLNKSWDVAVVDEIQMIGDPHRGYAWTDAVLGLPAKEIHLCGEASTVPLIRRMAEACGDQVHVHEYKRLTPLRVADESLSGDLSKIKRGDCIVAFSRSGIFNLKREIEQKTGLRCAVAYGALPPETKSEQAKLFNEGKFDVMVASDAIGMGLNLKIKRVIFDTMTKWNGKETVALSPSQIKQIAGRAGRYGTKREEDQAEGGIVTTRSEDELHILQEALEFPIVPINQAAIQPSSDVLAQLAAILPPVGPGGAQFLSLSEIYSDVSLLARIDPTSYFLSDFSQQHAISPLVERASRSMLTVEEREKFANAPANTRDERLMAFLSNAVRKFANGGLVRFDECAQGLGMLEMEELVSKATNEAAQTRDAKVAAGKPIDAPLASHLAPDHELLNATTLMLLESLHRSMCLYLWLSFRFPLAFCYRVTVEERKKRMEDGIEFCLEGIRFGRARRLRALGRAEEADKVFSKPRWQKPPPGL